MFRSGRFSSGLADLQVLPEQLPDRSTFGKSVNMSDNAFDNDGLLCAGDCKRLY